MLRSRYLPKSQRTRRQKVAFSCVPPRPRCTPQAVRMHARNAGADATHTALVRFPGCSPAVGISAAAKGRTSARPAGSSEKKSTPLYRVYERGGMARFVAQIGSANIPGTCLLSEVKPTWKAGAGLVELCLGWPKSLESPIGDQETPRL